MTVETMKANLRKYYDHDAKRRSTSDKQEWKCAERMKFSDLALKEHKSQLLEIGAGTGQDSMFFMEQGFEVMAIDLSAEMVRICKENKIKAMELDFYNLSSLDKKFDCVWSMNSLLHVNRPDLSMVLNKIDTVLNENGLFYMGVYGGEDTETNYAHDTYDSVRIPRYFSFYSIETLVGVLQKTFDILHYDQYDVERSYDFQSVTMRKKAMVA